MAFTSPASSHSQKSEGRHDSEMASEAECCRCQVASEDISVCRRSVASEAAPSGVASGPECADSRQSQSDVSATDLNLQQSEITVSGTVVGTTHDSKCWPMSIDNLPDEILIKILSYITFSELLDVVQKVCSRWRRLSQDVEVWADKQYHIMCWNYNNSDTSKGDKTDQEAIQTLRNAPNLPKVFMYRSAKSCLFRTLYTHCHRLSELQLHSSQKLSYSVLKHLVEKCSRIHTLTISNELLKSEKFSEAVSRLQHLRVLELEEHSSECRPVLRPLGDGCPQLAEVDFGSLTVNMDDLRYFLTAKRNTLKSVSIKWAMVGKRCVLPLLTVCADSLERLELYYFDIVHDEAREAFTALGSLKNLQELKTSLINPPPPGTAALAFKFGGLPKLRRLDLRAGFGLDNETVIAICHGCPSLRELVVRGAKLLSDAAFSQIYRLEHLEMLDVSGCRGLGGALIPCLTGLPQLRTLYLEELEFPKLQPGLSSILELSGLRCLTLVYSLVTGMPFDKFPSKLVSLRELNVQLCRGDPKATDVLFEQMPDLNIHGSIEADEAHMEGHEIDADIVEEGNEVNAEPEEGNEVNAEPEEGNEENAIPVNEHEMWLVDWDDWGIDTRGLNENVIAIWNESCIHAIFLEGV